MDTFSLLSLAVQSVGATLLDAALMPSRVATVNVYGLSHYDGIVSVITSHDTITGAHDRMSTTVDISV